MRGMWERWEVVEDYIGEGGGGNCEEGEEYGVMRRKKGKGNGEDVAGWLCDV